MANEKVATIILILHKSISVQAAKTIVRAFIMQFLFWMLFFAFTRLIFLLLHAGHLKEIDFISVVAVFWHALHLDLSTACFIMMFPFVILVLQSLWSPRFLNWVHIVYTAIILLAYSGVTIGEIGVYEEWRTKLHYKALLYLMDPGEIVNTAETWKFILLAFVFVLMVAGGFIAWYKWFFVRISGIRRSWVFTVIFFPVFSFLIILGLRGGLQPIPVNQSESYFSKHDILNLAAVNSGWNIGHSVFQNLSAAGKNPFVYYDEKDAAQTVENIHKTSCDSTLMALITTRPNIVMFILEGWSADLMPELGGDTGIAPYFSKLAEEGILFTDIYSSGTRSQQGMAAIYSGFPATSFRTITNEPEKYQKLPSLVKKLDSCGYQTSFLFGGQLNYGNMKSYLYYNDFNRIREGADLDAALPRGKLGVHDEYTFPVFLEEIDKEKPPFFASIFTMSTHSPYDQKMEEPITTYEIEAKYVNAARYTDQCVKKFMDEAKKKSWYANTLFVFISDHGHSTYKFRDFFSPAYHKIAFLLCGEVIHDSLRGIKISKTGAQHDLPATLLKQLNINSGEFRWSKNLLNPCSPGFAYFSFEGGLGWVRPCGYYVEELHINQLKYLEVSPECPHAKETLVKEGKSYLQTLYEEYLEY